MVIFTKNKKNCLVRGRSSDTKKDPIRLPVRGVVGRSLRSTDGSGTSLWKIEVFVGALEHVYDFPETVGNFNPPQVTSCPWFFRGVGRKTTMIELLLEDSPAMESMIRWLPATKENQTPRQDTIAELACRTGSCDCGGIITCQICNIFQLIIMKAYMKLHLVIDITLWCSY